MNPRIISFLKICSSLILISIALYKLDLLHVYQLMQDINISTYLMSLSCFIVCVCLTTLRWHVLLTFFGYRQFSNVSLCLATYIGHFFNQVLPSSIGGDIYRALWVKDIISLKKSSALLISDRLYGVFATSLIFFATTPFLIHPLPLRLTLITWGTSIGSILAILIIIILTQKLRRSVRFISFFETISCILLETYHNKKTFLSLILLSTFNIFIYVLPFYFILKDMHVGISIYDLYYISPMVIIVSALPISFAGWGVREGAFAFGMVCLGYDIQLALTSSILFGAIQMVSALPGALLFVITQSHKKRSES